MKTELITLPTFNFRQGSLGDNSFTQNPIQVVYYSNCIGLSQEGCSSKDIEILIDYDHLEALFNDIKRHKKEALLTLKK